MLMKKGKAEGKKKPLVHLGAKGLRVFWIGLLSLTQVIQAAGQTLTEEECSVELDGILGLL